MAILPSLATLADFEARLGVALEAGDQGRAQGALDDASAAIRSIADQDWATEGALDFGDLADRDVDTVRSVCVGVALRVFRNPEGVTQSSVGDVSVSYGRTPGGSVYLTESERAQIRRIAGTSGIGTIGLTSPFAPSFGSYYYVPVAQGGDPIPIGPFPWEV